MKHLFFTFLSLVLFAEMASASDCYEKLTQGYSKDSHAYQVYGESLSGDFSGLNLEMAITAVRAVVEKLDCAASELTLSNKELQTAACRRIHPRNSLSLSCFLESNLGYFTITEDMMGTLNVVFNRYD